VTLRISCKKNQRGIERSRTSCTEEELINDLTEKKVMSIVKKHSTIPTDKLLYDPAPPLTHDQIAEAKLREEEELESVSKIAEQRKRHRGAVPAQQKAPKILREEKKKIWKACKSDCSRPPCTVNLAIHEV
jgi:hypothetical protein